MKRGRAMGPGVRAAWLCALIGLVAIAPPVRAAAVYQEPGTDGSMLYSGSQLVVGNEANVEHFKVSGPGELVITLADMKFTNAFNNLSFALADTNSALGSLNGPGAMSVAVSGPMTLYADVFASATGAFDVGLYNLQVSFIPTSPVPLPDAGLLLVSALLMLAAYQHRRTHNCNTSHGLMGTHAEP